MTKTLFAAEPVPPAPVVHVHHHPCIPLHNLGWLVHRGGGGVWRALPKHFQETESLCGKHKRNLHFKLDGAW